MKRRSRPRRSIATALVPVVLSSCGAMGSKPGPPVACAADEVELAYQYKYLPTGIDRQSIPVQEWLPDLYREIPYWRTNKDGRVFMDRAKGLVLVDTDKFSAELLQEAESFAVTIFIYMHERPTQVVTCVRRPSTAVVIEPPPAGLLG